MITAQKSKTPRGLLPGALALEVSLAVTYFGSDRLSRLRRRALTATATPSRLVSASGSCAARACARELGHCPSKAKRPGDCSPGRLLWR
jgi:hypothetical protein